MNIVHSERCMSTTTIAIIITVVMAVLLVWGKFPFGLVTMACTFAMVLTGVIPVATAFAGLSNSTVIMVASMFVLSMALQKTNLPYIASSLIGKMQGKSDYILVFSMIVVFLIMEIVLPGMVCMVLIVTFLSVLPKGSEVTPARMILPMLMMTVCWEMAVPIGLGATMDFQANAYLTGIVTDPAQQLVLGNIFTVRIIPTIVTVLYVLFIWKKMPRRDELVIDENAGRKIEKSTLPMWKQVMVYLSFVVVIYVLVFSSKFSAIMWIVPGACACVLGFIGVLNKQEMINTAANDVIWMLVGVMGVTAGLTASGATDVIGTALTPLISWTNNGFIILSIITGFTALMTTFLSNTGTIAVLTPLVGAMAVAAGMDPRAMVICVSIGGTYAFCFPSGSTTCAFAFAYGQYNPLKCLKYTLPLLIILVLVTAACANFMFPLY